MMNELLLADLLILLKLRLRKVLLNFLYKISLSILYNLSIYIYIYSNGNKKNKIKNYSKITCYETVRCTRYLKLIISLIYIFCVM